MRKGLVIVGVICFAAAIGCGIYHMQVVEGKAQLQAALDSPEGRFRMASMSQKDRQEGAQILAYIELQSNLTLAGTVGFGVLGIVFIVLGIALRRPVAVAQTAGPNR